jgi:hypothetical protein
LARVAPARSGAAQIRTSLEVEVVLGEQRLKPRVQLLLVIDAVILRGSTVR